MTVRKALIFLAIASAWCTCGLAASVAHATKGVVETFGQAGTDAGEFDFPAGVAINQATGDIYVADADFQFSGGGEGQRIEQFDSNGQFVRAWGWGVATGTGAFEVCTTSCQAGITGAGDGQLALFAADPSGNVLEPPQIAIDQTDGSVYVADTGNNRVQKFSSTGAYIGQFGSEGTGSGQFNTPQGIAVAPGSGDVYVADTGNNRVQRFDSSGAYQSEIGTVAGGSGDGEFLQPKRLAVDSTGRLYVLDAGNGRVQRFAAGGSFDSIFAAGALNSPSDLTIDTAVDHVFVVGFNGDFSAGGILEFDAAGQPVDVHHTPSGFTPGGLAVRSSNGRIYASSPFTQQVLVLDDVNPPMVTIDPVTDVGSDVATFHGTVNPNGPPNTRYRFEYSTDGAGWTSVPASDVSIGQGGADISVTQVASSLEANTEYRVRLVATKDFGAGSATSGEVTFTTGLKPPRVRALDAGARTDTSVWLGGDIDPENASTSYYVEYTLASDVSYADSSRVPAAPGTGDAGSGTDFVTVRQLITGLEPATDYRFRVVATNAGGTTAGPDKTFATRPSAPAPPAGRGYEMVSPLDKNGGDIDRNFPRTSSSTEAAAASGDAVAYTAAAQFAGIPSGAQAGQYRSVRGADGWVTRGVSAPVDPDPILSVVSPTVEFLSDDLSRAVVSTDKAMTPDAGPPLGGSWGLYLQDIASDPLGYELLSRPASPLAPEASGADGIFRFSFAAATPDMSHVVFESNGRQLTPDGVATDWGVYEWAQGQVRFVSALPSGVPAARGAVGSGHNSAGQYYPGDHVVSNDGQRIFFVDRLDRDKLYVREGGAQTRAVSVSQRPGDSSDPQTATFQAARAADGGLALFTSPAKLTVDAKADFGSCEPTDSVTACHQDLYLWDAAAGSGHQLTDLTTQDSAGGGVMSIAGAADDLSRVYFVAGGALANGAKAGQPNLYVWSADDGVRFIAALDPRDSPVWNIERDARERQYRDARVTGDGSRLLFASRGSVTTQDSAGHKQIYLYDADRDQTTCVSCAPSAPVSQGESWLYYPPDLGTTPAVSEPRMPYRLPRNLSGDGKRVFFETDQKLISSDSNGKADVYMWEGGELSLVSTGGGEGPSEFVDASASGDDVFFTTRERLVGADTDNRVDIYDARVGGGFPEQSIPPACVGDQCQGSTSAPPDLSVPLGPAAGNPSKLKRPSFAAGRLSKTQRRALAAGRAVALRVRVNKAGRVTVRGTAKIGKRTRTVLSARRQARRAGTLRLSLRLSSGAQRALRMTGRMRLSLAVKFAGAAGAQTRPVVLVSGSGRRGR